MNKQEKGIISRRDFVRGGAATAASVGISSLLPVASHVLPEPVKMLVPKALAQEGVEGEDTEYVFQVVGIDQVGISVVDITKPKTEDDHYVGVKGMRIVVQSLDVPDASPQEVITSETGQVIVDIKDLTQKDEEGNPLGDLYQCNVSVSIYSDDKSMCDYFIPHDHFIGANAVMYEVEPYKGKPYLIGATFNMQDILHEWQVFFRSYKNKFEYPIHVRIKDVPDKTKVTLNFFKADDKSKKKPLIDELTAEARIKKLSNGYTFAEAEFKGKFLDENNKDGKCLPADKDNPLIVEICVQNYFTSDLKMKVIEAPVTAFEYTSPLNSLPANSANPGSFSLPLTDEDCGMFSMFKIGLFVPYLPVIFNITPVSIVFGLSIDIRVKNLKLPGNLPDPAPNGENGANVSNALATRSSISDDKDLFPWGVNPITHMEEHYKAVAETFKRIKNLGKETTPTIDKQGNTTHYKRFGSLSLDLVFQFLCMKQWGGLTSGTFESKEYSSTGTYSVGICFSGAYTWVTLATVPVFITLSGFFTACVAYNLECVHEIIKTGDNQRKVDVERAIDVWNTSLSIDFCLFLTVSGGVGFPGLFSLAIAACFTISPGLVFYEDGWKEKGNPHTYYSYVFRVELQFQLVLLRFSLTIFTLKGGNDNWKKKSEKELLTGLDAWGDRQPRFLLTHPDGQKRHTYTMVTDESGNFEILGANGDPFANMVPVDQNTMLNSREAIGTRKSNYTSGEDVLASETYVAKVHKNAAPCLVRKADGSFEVQLVEALGYHTFTFLETSSVTADAAGDTDTAAQEQSHEQEEQVSVEENASNQAADGQVDTGQEAANEQDGAKVIELQDADGQECVEQDVIESGSSEQEEGVLNDAIAMAVVPAAIAETVPDQEVEAVVQAAETTTIEELTSELLNKAVADANANATEYTDPYADEFFGLGKSLGEGSSVAEEFTYDCSKDNKTTRKECPLSGSVLTDQEGKAVTAPNGGIKPTIDIPVFDGVFSDARIRLIEIAGNMYQFRLSSIEYSLSETNTPRRTRLTVSKFTVSGGKGVWEEPKVLEYATGTPSHRRINLCDFDYDVIARQDNEDKWPQNIEACVVVVSGKNSDNFYEAASSQTFNVLLLDKDLRVVQRSVRSATQFFNDTDKHTIVSPRITGGFAPQGVSSVLGIAFIDRAAKDATDLMGFGAVAPTVRLVVGSCFLVGQKLSLDFRTTDTNGNHMVLNSAAFNLALAAGGGESDSWMRMIVSGAMGYEAWSAYVGSGQAFSECAIMQNIPYREETLPNIQPWTSRGTFLFAKDRSDMSEDNNKNDYYLYEGSFDLGTKQDRLSETRVDRGAIKGSQFCVSPSGSWLFYFESYESDPYPANFSNAVTAASNATSAVVKSSDASSDIYRMMASTLVGGKFCEDFIFCNLDHPVDNFSVAGANFSRESVFTTFEITDADKSVGTVRYLAVPYNILAEIQGFGPKSDWVIAGKPCAFQLDVFNHGNLIITGFKVSMHDKTSGDVIETVVDTFEPQNVLINATNGNFAENLHVSDSFNEFGVAPDTSNGDGVAAEASAPSTLKLSEEMKNGWLMPSKLMSYVVSFKIPETWKGERKVTLSLSDYRTINVSSEQGALQGDLINYHEHNGIDSMFEVADEQATGSASLYVPATYYPNGTQGDDSESAADDENNANNANNANSPNGSAAVTRQAAPNTGDAISMGAPIAAAIGGLGSLFAAYSARRTKVEREERKKAQENETDGE